MKTRLGGQPKRFDSRCEGLDFQKALAKGFPFVFVVRQIVEREDVDEYPLIEGIKRFSVTHFRFQDGRCFTVPQLRVSAGGPGICFVRLPEVRMLELRWGNGVQLGVLGPGHDDVQVVVPGNEPLVANGAKSRSAIAEIANAMLAAHLVELNEQVERHRPHLLASARNDQCLRLVVEKALGQMNGKVNHDSAPEIRIRKTSARRKAGRPDM